MLACGYLAGGLVVALMLLILVAVFMRYALHQPPMLADEFGGYTVVAVVFLGLGYTWYARGHVRITALVSNLPQKVSRWLRLVTLVLAFIFSIALAQASYGYLLQSFRMNMASMTIYRVPLQGPQMTILVGYALLCLITFMELLKAILDIRSSKHLEQEARRE